MSHYPPLDSPTTPNPAPPAATAAHPIQAHPASSSNPSTIQYSTMPPARTTIESNATKHAASKLGVRPNRQQNTACAPCRKRRVKCDRKDVQTGLDLRPICTECMQRDFQCVDDVREVKPQKLLRRGRKIQELEPIFGMAGGGPAYALSPSPTLERRAPPPPSAIPDLQIPFFKSKFYRRFHIQRPIVDPNEFIERFERFVTQGVPLGTYGGLIAKILATWAASYGVDEQGEEEPHDGLVGVERRRAKTNIMVLELLATIDKYAVMRNISWDGVRVLLLLIPLTEEVQSDADRATMYQSTVLQVYSLSNMSEALQVNEVGTRVDQMVRARIFWYGHVHEGLTNGLKGRKLIFDQDDVDSFRTPLSTRDYNLSLTKSPVTNSYTYRYATAPIRLAAACRLVNTSLTGPKAERSVHVDRAGMDRVWSAFAECWEEFESLRDPGTNGTGSTDEDTDRFISGWQIFIFEALSIIRQKLSDRINRLQDPRLVPVGEAQPDVQAALTDLMHLADIAESKCQEMIVPVMQLIRRHVNTAFFEYDASLCRDGVFYAGERIAGETNSDDDVRVCMQALTEMRWAYSKSTERTERLQNLWRSRQPPSSAILQPPYPISTSRRPSVFMDESSGFPPLRNVFDPLGESNPQADMYDISTSVYPPSGPATPPFSHTIPYSKHESPVGSPGGTLRVVSYETAFSGTHSGAPSRIPSLSISKAGSRSPPSSLTSPVTFTFGNDVYGDQPRQQQEIHGGNRYQQPIMQHFVDPSTLYYNEPNTFNASNPTAFPDVLHFDAVTPHRQRPVMSRVASHHSDYTSPTHSAAAVYNTGPTDMLEYVNHDPSGMHSSSPLSAYNNAAAAVAELGATSTTPTSYTTFTYSS